MKININVPNYIGFINKWYVFRNDDWTSFTAKSENDNVVLEADTLQGLDWLIKQRG